MGKTTASDIVHIVQLFRNPFLFLSSGIKEEIFVFGLAK
jgi:hypothetical protein